jgi:hypothetical protein
MATVATVAVTEALTTTAERVAALALSAPDPDLMVPATPGWSVTDVLGHLALEPTRYRDLILGRGQWPSEVVDLPVFNGQQIRSLPTRNVSDLAATLRAEVAFVLATATDFGDEPTMMKFDTATNGSEPTGTGHAAWRIRRPRPRHRRGARASLADRAGPCADRHGRAAPSDARLGRSGQGDRPYRDLRAAPARTSHYSSTALSFSNSVSSPDALR